MLDVHRSEWFIWWSSSSWMPFYTNNHIGWVWATTVSVFRTKPIKTSPWSEPRLELAPIVSQFASPDFLAQAWTRLHQQSVIVFFIIKLLSNCPSMFPSHFPAHLTPLRCPLFFPPDGFAVQTFCPRASLWRQFSGAVRSSLTACCSLYSTVQ